MENEVSKYYDIFSCGKSPVYRLCLYKFVGQERSIVFTRDLIHEDWLDVRHETVNLIGEITNAVDRRRMYEADVFYEVSVYKVPEGGSDETAWMWQLRKRTPVAQNMNQASFAPTSVEIPKKVHFAHNDEIEVIATSSIFHKTPKDAMVNYMETAQVCERIFGDLFPINIGLDEKDFDTYTMGAPGETMGIPGA